MKESKQTGVSQLPVAKIGSVQLERARKIDEIASGAIELFKEAGSFEQEIGVAQAMSDLRVALTDDLMAPIMSLMNTDLGFRTDRDPKLQPKDKEGNPMTPYPAEVVRDCVIEAKLRGFHVVGNEFNIIAGRFYAAKNGLKRKCEKWPGVTDLKINYGVPKIVGEKGAIVPVKATWKRDGIADSIDAEIPVRINAGMGADAIIGKTERKISKRIHDRLSGMITPDGDISEETEGAAPASTKPKPTFDNVTEAEVVKEKSAEPAPTTSAPAEAPKTDTSAAAQELENILKAEGLTFEDFKAWAKESGSVDCSAIKSFADLSPAAAARWIGAKAGLIGSIRRVKGGAK
jgi:hypothetical protein